MDRQGLFPGAMDVKTRPELVSGEVGHRFPPDRLSIGLDDPCLHLPPRLGLPSPAQLLHNYHTTTTASVVRCTRHSLLLANARLGQTTLFRRTYFYTRGHSSYQHSPSDGSFASPEHSLKSAKLNLQHGSGLFTPLGEPGWHTNQEYRMDLGMKFALQLEVASR